MSHIITIHPVKEMHRYYSKQTDGIQLFSTKKELLEIIERMKQEDYRQSNEQNLELAKQYSVENVANIYRELLGMEALKNGGVIVSNLIIATTPLQAKIAKYIQREYADETFVSLYLTPVMNERHRYYSQGFTEVYCMQTVEDYEKVIEKYSGEYETIFYASFDHPVILDIVASSSYQHLMSFDDGYANIYPYGMYALPLTNQQIGKLGVTRDNLIRKTEKHYTLYQTNYHVVDKEKLVYLDKFFNTDIQPVSNGKIVRVLLGQKFSETDDAISVRFITTYANALNINYYIPHPKEAFHIEVQYLNSPYIVEDVLAELWKEYEFIEIYHFTSSVSLHLKNVKNIKITGIAIPYYEKRQNELRRLGCDFETVTIGW